MTEIRVYSRQLETTGVDEQNGPNIHRDRWADLEAFDERVGWVSRSDFLAEAQARLTAGEHVYTIAENGHLVHYGWTAAPVQRRYVSEVGLTAELSPDSAYLYDFFTHPEHRNQGFYQITLNQILRDFGTDSRLRAAYIVVSAINGASRRAIEKLGFVYKYSLFQKWSWNRVQRWTTTPTDDMESNDDGWQKRP